MTIHPLRRLVANAINHGCLLICGEQFVKALTVLFEALDNCEAMLPPAVRVAWGDVKRKGELV